MRLTDEEKRGLQYKIDLLTACLEGKDVQLYDRKDGKWKDLSFVPTFNFGEVEYRLKPEPVAPKAWTRETVPKNLCGTVVKRKASCSCYVIVGVVADEEKVYVGDSCHAVSFEDLGKDFIRMPDGLPCSECMEDEDD